MKRHLRRRRQLPKAEINITNLVDVTMTLLVVFMIVAPLLHQGLEIQLPEARVAEELRSDDQVILVECSRDGLVQINRKEILPNDLEQNLRDLIDRTGLLPVQVRADKDLAFGSIVSLWGEIKAAGVDSISVELVKTSLGS